MTVSGRRVLVKVQRPIILTIFDHGPKKVGNIFFSWPTTTKKISPKSEMVMSGACVDLVWNDPFVKFGIVSVYRRFTLNIWKIVKLNFLTMPAFFVFYF